MSLSGVAHSMTTLAGSLNDSPMRTNPSPTAKMAMPARRIRAARRRRRWRRHFDLDLVEPDAGSRSDDKLCRDKFWLVVVRLRLVVVRRRFEQMHDQGPTAAVIAADQPHVGEA